MAFGVVIDRRMLEDALIGSLRGIVETPDPAADADFLAEFHARLENIGVEPQELINLVE